ncbi:protein of unknown function [Kyrpidia spormannii]|uniref:Uncharacterized protein n=1 Tax=Kyrpidia spormannii TaxID=2055160 RepID=A0ACA8Z523_9BACL|nr:protein of unknown function [Kyrpidia spormannii]
MDFRWIAHNRYVRLNVVSVVVSIEPNAKRCGKHFARLPLQVNTYFSDQVAHDTLMVRGRRWRHIVNRAINSLPPLKL